MKTNPDDTAYPILDRVNCPGLTKREYFAAMAMQGLVANPDRDASVEQDSTLSVKQADALIAALNKETESK
jgi:hypothetical protein